MLGDYFLTGTTRRYWWQFALLTALFMLAVVAAVGWAKSTSSPLLRTLAALSSLPCMLGLACVEYRRILRTDELRRRIELEAGTLAITLSIVVVMTLGLLDEAGVLRLPLIAAAPVMCLVYLAAQFWAHWRYR